MTKTISAKVSLDMYKKIQNIVKANNLTISSLIKLAITKSKIEDKTLKLQKLRELNRIGNNLNQIAKKLNITKFVDNKILEEIKEIREKIFDL